MAKNKGGLEQMIYIVSFDGWLGGYGSEIYILGVYDDPDKAIEAKELFDRKYENYDLVADIDEVVLNQEYDVKVKECDAASTSVCLGGYLE